MQLVKCLKIYDKVFEKLFKLNRSLSSKPLLIAVKNGFTMMIPFVLIGSLALIILSLPINAYQNFMTRSFGSEWKNILQYIRDGTFNSFSLILVVFMSYSYIRERNEFMEYTSPIIASMVSLGSFIALSGINEKGFAMSSFGVVGIFIALLVAFFSSELFFRINKIKVFRFRMLTDGANPGFNNAISLFIPAAVTIAAFAVLNEAFSYLLHIADIQVFISDNLSNLFSHIHSEFWRGILFILFIHVFWFFGIHGSNMLESAAQGIFVPALHANQQLIASGQAPVHIFTKTFFDTFVLMGGCGAIICLVLAILIMKGHKSQKRLAKLSLIPVLFNINELIIFGIPIVLNPIYIIPFLCVPLLLTTISYVAMQLGIVPFTQNLVEWTTPVILSGYKATGSAMGSILQLVNLVVGTLCYIPFVKLSKKVNEAQNNMNLEKVYTAFNHSEQRGVISALLSRHDSIGSIARSLTADFQHDLMNGSIDLYYQPIVNQQEEVVCLEALLRWKHESYGFIYPPLVIGLAEESQLICKLGNLIFEKACSDLALLRERGIENITIAVNVSTAQLEDENFIGALHKTMQRYLIKPINLQIEITERLALSGSRKISGQIAAINELGVKLAMDDFGMGHSSLMYLKEYNFDTIKLDGSLVREIIPNSNCRSIISTIVSLGHTMNYHVVAEFVEEQEQREILHELGCDFFQGWLFSKAVPFHDALAYILSKRKTHETV